MIRVVVRNLAEYLAIVALWAVMVRTEDAGVVPGWMLAGLVLLLAWCKTLFFGAENLQQLWTAARMNMAYHRFLVLMLVNMSQIILSFALDYHLLHRIDPGSFGGMPETSGEAATVFELAYYSVLNFTFFGYGDVTPQSIPAKLLTMTEILLAFVTVIFLLSDFISLKESIAVGTRRSATGVVAETSAPVSGTAASSPVASLSGMEPPDTPQDSASAPRP